MVVTDAHQERDSKSIDRSWRTLKFQIQQHPSSRLIIKSVIWLFVCVAMILGLPRYGFDSTITETATMSEDASKLRLMHHKDETHDGDRDVHHALSTRTNCAISAMQQKGLIVVGRNRKDEGPDLFLSDDSKLLEFGVAILLAERLCWSSIVVHDDNHNADQRSNKLKMKCGAIPSTTTNIDGTIYSHETMVNATLLRSAQKKTVEDKTTHKTIVDARLPSLEEAQIYQQFLNHTAVVMIPDPPTTTTTIADMTEWVDALLLQGNNKGQYYNVVDLRNYNYTGWIAMEVMFEKNVLRRKILERINAGDGGCSST